MITVVTMVLIASLSFILVFGGYSLKRGEKKMTDDEIRIKDVDFITK